MKDTLFDYTVQNNKGAETSLADYRGKALLIVNTASKCGFTPQYAGLEALYKEYGAKGLVVLGFPCDQFAHQEPGDDAEIAQFCQLNFGVTFPLMGKIEVNGTNASPVYGFLKKKSRGFFGKSIKWNFTKFLVSPDGKTVQRFAPTVEPADLKPAIERILG